MEKNIIIIPPNTEKKRNYEGESKEKIRVAAYCRVSTAMEDQLHSYDAQVQYYTKYINDHPDYIFAGVYGDEGKSGTGEQWRDGFQRLINDCAAGKIDMVITKSISRFARNTQDCLKYSRKLKDMGIPIIFEKERINSMDSSGELFFTILSSLAQEESRNISENVKWGYRTLFQQGKVVVNAKRFLGFDKDEHGKLVINEEQAEVVRLIFHYFEMGYTEQLIAHRLNRDGIAGINGTASWEEGTIHQVLTNEKNKGDLCLQKTFVPDYLTKRSYENSGQLDKFYVKNDHEAIISPDEWEAVQMEMERRETYKTQYGIKCFRYCGEINAFTGKVVCAECQSAYTVVRKGLMRCKGRGRGCTNRDISVDELEQHFIKVWNEKVRKCDFMQDVWNRAIEAGTPLQRLRARQMERFCRAGEIDGFDGELALATLAFVEIKTDRTIYHFLDETTI